MEDTRKALKQLTFKSPTGADIAMELTDVEIDAIIECFFHTGWDDPDSTNYRVMEE